MNELQIFSKEVIPVYITDKGEKVVIGRELHEQLKISSKYADWFKNMCGYGFKEKTDYSTFSKNLESGGRSIEHVLKLDMAKHIAMIQRTDEGFKIRQKLIELEQNVQGKLSELSPQLQLLINIETKQKAQDIAIADTNKKLDGIGDIISLNNDAWRTDSKTMIVKIAVAMGGMEYIKEVNTMIYDLLNRRFAVNIERRQMNTRRRMADEGISKSKRDNLTKVDIIAEDKKLIEGYVCIIKELAIKYGVWKGDKNVV